MLISEIKSILMQPNEKKIDRHTCNKCMYHGLWVGLYILFSNCNIELILKIDQNYYTHYMNDINNFKVIKLLKHILSMNECTCKKHLGKIRFLVWEGVGWLNYKHSKPEEGFCPAIWLNEQSTEYIHSLEHSITDSCLSYRL